ncbi:hypothetical protein TorRG33x02_311450 [Trema orientale]|uniref:Uncharacterized protein n=1 Tax=Trema orientale TaxID=63057 RepID=A0A2P5BRE0_TREOI|nr:hypothetical protein TorRG33x02_311450 [Trema orientale]
MLRSTQSRWFSGVPNQPEVTWFFAQLTCTSPGFFMLGMAKFLAKDGPAMLREQIAAHGLVRLERTSL